MDQEEAPPPYAAVDPLHDGAGPSQQTSVPVRDNGLGSSAAGSSRIAELPPSNIPAVVPTHFTSAAAYFEERPPSVLDDTRSVLNHHMTIYPRSQAKDFPRRPRCWASRTADIPQQDWDTFLRYLFPSELGLASASQHLPRQLRAEIQRDRKDRPQESDEQRRARIMTVVDEWNQCFFEPRATRIVFVYIGEPDAAPSTALCPRCYPAATRTTQGSSTASVSSDPQSPWTPNTPSPVPGQHAQTWPAQPSPYGAPPGQVPYGPQFGAPPGHYHHPPPPPPGVPPWQWNNYAYAQPQNTNPGSGKTGRGWISNITAQAQKYGDRFAEQAQRYGDQISGQAMHYGRQIEEHAMAHGRWIEEQARFGRKPNPYAPAGYYHHPAWGPPPPNTNMYHNPTPPIQASPVELDSSTSAPPTTQPQVPAQTPSPQKPQSPVKEVEKNINPAESTRRASVSSTASESSLSSFNSISTTSDLDASDLAQIRTQLQSLNACHERTLYDAAADLRHQLDVLQVSRREAHASGRHNWRHGHRNPGGNDQQGRDDSDWGRFDSPEAQERQATEKKNMKDELRATKKAFREVVRRARQEQHEAKRARKNRRRQLKNKSVDGTSNLNGPILAQRMDNLTLNQPQPVQPARVQTQPGIQAYPTFPPPPGRGDTGSVLSSVGSLHTPTSSQASMHELPAEPDRKGKSGMQKKLRDKLKRGSKKRQEKDSTELASKNDDTKPDGASSRKEKD